MNQGGEPEHDDYGLPQVEVDIPDDARELDADVQAYRRELRAKRRQARSDRWRGSGFAHTGLLTPLIAACLLFAMLSGIVLTMFTAGSYFTGAVRTRPSARSPTARSPIARSPIAQPGMRLPGAPIQVGGRPVVLSRLRAVALAVIPRPGRCGCAAEVRALLQQAATAGVAVYLVGPPGSQREISSLTSGMTAGGRAYPAADTADVLVSAYRTGLTVLLVDARGYATAATGLRPGFRLENRLASLRGGGR